MTPTTLRMLVTDRVNQIVFVTVALVIGVAYTVMLPFAYTQRITLRNWQYLDVRYLAFSIGFGLATGWLLMSQTYAIRRVVRSGGGMVGGAGVLAGLVPSLLCCSPIVPTLLGFIGLSGSSLSRVSGRTQYIFATRENLILAASLSLMILACVWSTRRILRAACVTDEGCPVPETEQRDAAASANTCGVPATGTTSHTERVGAHHG